MAYTYSPTFFLIRLLLFHFVLSQCAISVFADKPVTPLRGRENVHEYVLCLPEDRVKHIPALTTIVPTSFPSSARCYQSSTHVSIKGDLVMCYNLCIGVESFWYVTLHPSGTTEIVCLSLAEMKAQITTLDQMPSGSRSSKLEGYCNYPALQVHGNQDVVRQCLKGLHSPQC